MGGKLYKHRALNTKQIALLFRETEAPIFKKNISETMSIAFFKKSYGVFKIAPGKYLTPDEVLHMVDFSKSLSSVLAEVNYAVTVREQQLHQACERLKELIQIIDKILYKKMGQELCSSCEWKIASSGREITFMLLEHFIGNALVNYCLLAKRFIKKNEAITPEQLALDNLEWLLDNIKHYMFLKQQDINLKTARKKTSTKTFSFSLAGWAK